MKEKKTTIQVTPEIALKIQKYRESLGESYNDILKRILNFYETNSKD